MTLLIIDKEKLEERKKGYSDKMSSVQSALVANFYRGKEIAADEILEQMTPTTRPEIEAAAKEYATKIIEGHVPWDQVDETKKDAYLACYDRIVELVKQK